MMRCKKHPCDHSSGLGVCASCLRERLLALIAAQAQLHHHPQLTQLARLHSRATLTDHCQISDPHNPPPLLFPRSVSPYVRRRKSEDTPSWSHHHRFYSTPQLGPTYNTTNDPSSSATTTSTSYSRKHRSRFSLFSNLFRSRSEKLTPDPSSRDASSSSYSSPSWFSIFSTRPKTQSNQFSLENTGAANRKPRRRIDRGMSPSRGADSDEDCHCDQSPSGSGYSSESSAGRKRTPVAQSVSRRGKAAHQKNMSGLAFCLSPLVRASPKRQWNQKGGLPPDMGYSGEVRVRAKPHLSTAASFCANRSRKLVDFGKVTHNR